MTIDFKQKKGFNFEIDLEKSTSFSDLKLFLENGIDDCLEFFDLEKNGWNSLKHRMYFLNCLCSFEPSKGMSFSYYESDLNSSKVPVLYQIEKDNPIGNGTLLKFDTFIIPLAYQSLKGNQLTNDVCADICEKYFDRINRKYFDFIDKEVEPEQNDIVAVVEQVAPDLVVTTFEGLPSAEKTVEVQEKQPPKDDYQQLLDNIEKSIQYVSDDKMSYHDRAQKNTELCVYIDRLSRYAYEANTEAVKSKNIAEKEFYKHYYGFLEDPKNTAENGRKPSDASAKSYATNLTLDLYCDSELSEKLARHLSDRIKTLDSISKSVLQEISNAKKIEEQSKIQK